MASVAESDIPTTTKSGFAVDLPPGDINPLPAKLRRQFYPPTILLHALGTPTVLKRRSHDDTSSGVDVYPQQIFHSFVNRLALICQVECNGDAVSSCVVTQEPDKILYVFASNYRSDKQLEDVARSLRDILKMVPPFDETADDPVSETCGEMLRAVIALAGPRIWRYLNALGQQTEQCIASCERRGTERDKRLSLALGEIARLAARATETVESPKCIGDNESFTHATQAVIEELEKMHKNRYLFSLIRRRVVSEDKQGSTTYWTEMCHISDRLKAYKSAIDTIFVARDNWPELFEDFEVRFIPSFMRGPNPLIGGPKTSAQLIRVTTSDKTLLPRLEADLADLQQKHNIDQIIADKWRQGLKPTVHAEVQIYNWLECSGGTRPGRFFGRYKFIGSSKPTCKLCSYYFDECGTDVQVRPSHRNLYPSWRMPDVLEDDEEGKKRRNDIIHKIKKRVVADIERTINEKLADYRVHDSTDQNGRHLGSHLSTSLADTLSSRMDNLSLVGEVDEVSEAIDTITFQGRHNLGRAGRQ